MPQIRGRGNFTLKDLGHMSPVASFKLEVTKPQHGVLCMQEGQSAEEARLCPVGNQGTPSRENITGVETYVHISHSMLDCRRVRAQRRPGCAPSAGRAPCAWQPSGTSRASGAACAPTTSLWRPPGRQPCPLLWLRRWLPIFLACRPQVKL